MEVLGKVRKDNNITAYSRRALRVSLRALLATRVVKRADFPIPISLEFVSKMRLLCASLLILPALLYAAYFSLLSPPPGSKVTLLPPQSPRHLRLLIGILTRPDKYSTRHFLRLVYGTQPSVPFVTVDVRFVLCRLTSEEQKLLVSLEILHSRDIIILNCTENMDSGKTYTYFSSLPSILPSPYDYVIKTDDDTYLRVPELVAELQPLSRSDLYFGYVASCANMNPNQGYMSGMRYALSWDLVEWIASSDVPLQDLKGPEDVMVGKWLDNGEKAKHRHTAKPRMYDFPGSKLGCPRDLVPDTVAVHRLKTTESWMAVLSYFNATQALKPSKRYIME